MLHTTFRNQKTYEDLIEEVIAQIPLYSDEWTNVNESDPGITVLQNFAAFFLLQQESIQTITEEGKRNLLKLAGYVAKENRGSRVLLTLLKAPKAPVRLPSHFRMMLGETCFETKDPVTVTEGGLTSVYLDRGGTLSDVSYLLDDEVPMRVEISGAVLYFGFSRQPKNSLRLYVGCGVGAERNSFSEGENPVFGRTLWQCYTESGWADMAVRDSTGAFLQSGEIQLTLKEGQPYILHTLPIPTYAVRCILKEEQYDILPAIHAVYDNLLEVVQKKTLGAVFSFDTPEVLVESRLADEACIHVFAREEENGLYYQYQKYQIGNGEGGQKGRYYCLLEHENGRFRIGFDKAGFGCGPCNGRDCVRVVCYDKELINHRSLGLVYGYDNQILELEDARGTIREDFSIMAEARDGNGERIYSFHRPGSDGDERLGYEIFPDKQTLCIKNPGIGGECRLYLCGFSVTEGEAGNLRAGNRLTVAEELVFANVAAGRGGRSYESVERLTARFAEVFDRTETAVLAADYEYLVFGTPGLCIDKVKAVLDKQSSLVRIAVKPKSQEACPGLSELYQEAIIKHLEDKRLLTTELCLCEPRYVPIHVTGRIYIKGSGCREQIVTILRNELEFLSSGADFGAVISINHIYEQIQNLEQVSYIYELNIRASQEWDTECLATEIRLGDSCLSVLGQVTLDLMS